MMEIDSDRNLLVFGLWPVDTESHRHVQIRTLLQNSGHVRKDSFLNLPVRHDGDRFRSESSRVRTLARRYREPPSRSDSDTPAKLWSRPERFVFESARST